MPPQKENDTSSLEKVKERLYGATSSAPTFSEQAPSTPRSGSVPHGWGTPTLAEVHQGKRHVRLATIFLIGASIFFIASLSVAGYVLYFGSNSVSVDKIEIVLAGPATIAGGDTVPLSLTITNKNPVSIQNATIEIDFPEGTLSGDGSLAPYPRYTETIGTLASGESITRSLKLIIFGGAGEALTLPAVFSYGTGGSTTSFVKKSSYALAVSSTPLSVSVESLSEVVSGKPLTFSITVRSNATLPLENVVLSGILPFGFTVTDSSVPLSGSSFVLGTLAPGATKRLTLTGTLAGQNKDERVFHFTVGTAKERADSTVAIPYMTQDVSVVIAAPFMTTTLALNGDTRPDSVVTAGAPQTATLSYTNTLSTDIADATIAVTLSGSAVDYNSIQTSSGFYRSSDHTIIYSKDTDPALARLAPGASGVGSFTFATLPVGALGSAPSLTFTTSVSGTRVGQSNVPETSTVVLAKTIKVAASVSLVAKSLHTTGPFGNSGPIPPRADKATTYTVVWGVTNRGSAIADGSVSATLPSYVTYTGNTSVSSITYDAKSRAVTWQTGDLAQGASAQGAFQVSLTPSISQIRSAPFLTSLATFSGYDRFASVQVKASAGPPSTETASEAGYVSGSGTVQ